MLRFESLLESLHDPSVTLSIVKQQSLGALVPSYGALSGDGEGFVRRHLVHIGVLAHVKLGTPLSLDAIEYSCDSHLGLKPITHPEFRAI